MFKKVFVSLAVFMLLTPSNAQQDAQLVDDDHQAEGQQEGTPQEEEHFEQEQEYEQEDGMYQLQGLCPEIKNSMAQRGEKLDVQKLIGQWKTIYESQQQYHLSDCITEKFASFGGNSSELQQYSGIKYDVNGKWGMYQDDNRFLTFSHPTNSGQAARQGREQYNDPGYTQYKEETLRQIRDLTEEEKKTMTEDELMDFNERKDAILMEHPQLQKKLDSMNPYDDSLHVLDTDYDNYTINYSCIDTGVERNAVGQTKEDVEILKVLHTDNLFYEEFKTSHQIQAQINVRSLNITEAKRQEYVDKLHDMVPGHDWTKTYHTLFNHGADCPSDDIDFFTQHGIRNINELSGLSPESLEEEEPELSEEEQKIQALIKAKDDMFANLKEGDELNEQMKRYEENYDEILNKVDHDEGDL